VRRTWLAIAVATLIWLPLRADAQTAGAGRVEVSAGAHWVGAVPFGTTAATETTFGGGTRRLFNSSSQLEPSVGGHVGVGVRLTSGLRVEFGLAYNPTGLSTRVSGDVEQVSDITVKAPVTQFLFEGGLQARPARWTRGHLSPFATAGVGYLRQLNDGRTLVETGRAWYVGGGLYYERPATRPRRLKATGVRGDLRALILRDGVAPDDTRRVAPAITVAVFGRF
jgi:opacity protein-like surface antigen